MRNALLPLLLILLVVTSAIAPGGTPATEEAGQRQKRRLRASQVFDLQNPVIFHEDFARGTLDRWNFSENDQYGLVKPNPERICVVEAPLLGKAQKAVRMVVERAPNSFRSEISLPSEKGFQERWYSERILIPDEWVFDPARANDLVMQWHAIPGNWKATYPNLEISIGNDRWFVRQSFGSPQTQPTRTNTALDETVKRGVWVAWVIHAKWSPKADGLVQVWKDGKLVFERNGPNVYGTIGVEYTPYLKTGIYHPEWHLDTERKRAAFELERPVALRKIVYLAEVKVGSERACFADMAPPVSAK